VGLLLVGTVPIAATAVLVDNDSRQPSHSDGFWSHFSPPGREAENFDSLRESVDAADAVVVGRIESLGPGRVIGDPASEYATYFVVATIAVDSIVHGSVESRTVALELVQFSPPDVEALRSKLPQEDAVFILRNKGTEAAFLGLPESVQETERAYYRLINSQSLFRNVAGKVRTAVGASDEYVVSLRGTSFMQLVDLIRSQGG
jgi:hypothetical protein